MKLLITACSKEGFEECPAGAWTPALNREKCLISKGQRGISMAATFYEAITPLHITAHRLKLLWSCSACTHLASPPAWHIWLCKQLLFQFYNPFNSLNSWRDLFRSTVIKYDKRRPCSCLLLPAGFTSTSILLFFLPITTPEAQEALQCLTEGLGKSRCSEELNSIHETPCKDAKLHNSWASSGTCWGPFSTKSLEFNSTKKQSCI